MRHQWCAWHILRARHLNLKAIPQSCIKHFPNGHATEVCLAYARLHLGPIVFHLKTSILNEVVHPSWTKTRADDIISSRPAFFQASPATHRQILRPHHPPGGISPTSRPAVPVVPYSLVLQVTGNHSLDSYHFCILSF